MNAPLTVVMTPGLLAVAPPVTGSIGLRPQRGGFVGRGCAVLLAGVAFGWVADDVQDRVGDHDTLSKLSVCFGGASRTDAGVTRSMVLTAALVDAGHAIQAGRAGQSL